MVILCDTSSISPLEIINDWLDKKVIVWDDDKQRLISDWATLSEHSQPKAEKNRFKELTRYKYVGT